MDPLTPLDTLCRIVLRGREYEAQIPTDFEGNEAAADADDEAGEMLSALDSTTDTSVEEELRSALDGLAEDQLAEVLAFCWVGQGTYDATEWDEAIEEASQEKGAIDELIDMPMMASVLEAGMAAFDLSCDGIGDMS